MNQPLFCAQEADSLTIPRLQNFVQRIYYTRKWIELILIKQMVAMKWIQRRKGKLVIYIIIKILLSLI